MKTRCWLSGIISFMFHVVASQNTPPHFLSKGKQIEMSSTECLLQKILREQASLKLSFSFLVEAAKICLTQPISNTRVEKGARAVKSSRNRLFIYFSIQLPL